MADPITKVVNGIITLVQRQVLPDAARLTIAARVPNNAPLHPNNIQPLIPANTLLSVLDSNLNHFTNITGLTILASKSNVPAVRGPINYELISAIVLPIVVILAVAILVGGMIIITVVA